MGASCDSAHDGEGAVEIDCLRRGPSKHGGGPTPREDMLAEIQNGYKTGELESALKRASGNSRATLRMPKYVDVPDIKPKEKKSPHGQDDFAEEDHDHYLRPSKYLSLAEHRAHEESRSPSRSP